MRALTIIQAKPNPAGKDRTRLFTPQSQLSAEWVDFQNTGNKDYPMSDIILQHIAYKSGYPNGLWETVESFTGSLPVGKVVRVHSGGEIPLQQLAPIDLVGADYHIFTGENYVWNNTRADSPRLINKATRTVVDETSYLPSPNEGHILRRQGNYLI